MKLRVERYSIEIVPEGPVDEAFLEEVLGLRRGNDWCEAIRRNALGLSCWGLLEIHPTPQQSEAKP